ncbi:MAG: biotin/lipoyl-binding protein [Flavobacteriia bacterium]
MSRNKSIFFILGLVIIGCAIWIYFPRQDIKPKEIKTQKEAISNSPFKHDSIVKNKTVADDLSYSFSIEPEFEKKVNFKISGELEAFKWRKGDKFKKGDLLFLLDNRDLFHQISEAKKQLKINVTENLKEIRDENFKQKWQVFLSETKEDDLLPAVPSFYASGFKEIQINNNVIEDLNLIQSLETSVLDYFYLAPFDGEFKEISLKKGNTVKENKSFAIIHPIKYAIIKGEIPESLLVYYKENAVIHENERFVKSEKLSNGNVMIYKKIKKKYISSTPFYNFYVLMR